MGDARPVLFVNSTVIAPSNRLFDGEALDINDQYGSNGVGQIVGVTGVTGVAFVELIHGYVYTNGEMVSLKSLS